MPQVGAEVDETFRDHMDDQPRTLQNPADGKKLRIHDNAPMPGEDLRPHDNIGNVGFVLEGEENRALGGAGPLPDQYEAGNGYSFGEPRILAPVLHVAQGAKRRETVAEEADGMGFQRQAGGGVILRNVFAQCHVRKGDLRLGKQIVTHMRRQQGK